MRVGKTEPTVPFKCQPIRNRQLFKGNACQPIRDNSNLSIRDRNFKETQKAVEYTNRHSKISKAESFAKMVIGFLFGVAVTLIFKSK